MGALSTLRRLNRRKICILLQKALAYVYVNNLSDEGNYCEDDKHINNLIRNKTTLITDFLSCLVSLSLSFSSFSQRGTLVETRGGA